LPTKQPPTCALRIWILAAMQSFGNFAASIIAGTLLTALSPSRAFAYLAGAMIIAVPLIARR
jgi:hypothetical protein